MVSTKTKPNLPIVFEDSQLLIINKPPGILSQKDHTNDPDVLSLCKKYLSRHTNHSYLGLLHRLDRPVGGLMMLAKSSRAARDISKQMRDRLIQKTYHAVVEGRPPANGVLTHFLIKNRKSNYVKAGSVDDKKSKRAILSFARLQQAKNLALLSIHLQTGRPHQIRVQLAAEKFPVWGDYKYGRSQPDGRLIALRSMEIAFIHPSTKEEMRFNLPMPDAEPWDLFNVNSK